MTDSADDQQKIDAWYRARFPDGDRSSPALRAIGYEALEAEVVKLTRVWGWQRRFAVAAADWSGPRTGAMQAFVDNGGFVCSEEQRAELIEQAIEGLASYEKTLVKRPHFDPTGAGANDLRWLVGYFELVPLETPKRRLFRRSPKAV